MPSFGPVAPIYDDLMHTVPYRMWASYYLLLLSQQGVKPKKILDVCCGTGTMCELLHDEGFQLAGFDLSAPMISKAKEKARFSLKNIRYECMDAASFEMHDTYEGAFSFFDSLNYITEPEKLASAMRQVSKHLQPGGSFIFDLNTSYAFEAKLFDQKNTNPKSKVRYKWESDWDPENRIITVHMKFWTDDAEYEETHVQRAYADADVRRMLIEAGFTSIETFHSYTLNKPRQKSDRIHYTAIKA